MCVYTHKAVDAENLCPSAEKNRTELILGDMPMSTTKAEMLRTMRMKCLDCTCNQVKEVQLCPAEDCPLWPFRMGKDPNKKARQMSEAQKAALDAARRKAANSRAAKNT